MVDVLEVRPDRIVERPIVGGVAPLYSARQARFAVSIHGDLMTALVKAGREMRDEQLSPAVAFWRHRDKRRADNRDAHDAMGAAKRLPVHPLGAGGIRLKHSR